MLPAAPQRALSLFAEMEQLFEELITRQNRLSIGRCLLL